MLLADLAATSRAVAATSARSGKVALIADCLRRTAPAETPVAADYLAGRLRQRRPGVGWAILRDTPAPAAGPSLTLLDADAVFEQVAALAGPGSAGERRRLVHALLSAATADEQHLLRGLLSGEPRQGALESLVVDAVARASGLPVTDVRRAVMLRGALAPVAAAALHEGAAGLSAFRLQVGRPVQPMLAQTAGSVGEAVTGLGEAAVEWKLDGVRVQVHRDGDDVAVFTRTLDDITARVPELVTAARGLPARSLIVDGEAIALRPDGRPRPFQETAARVATRRGPAPDVPLTPYLFDLLHLDGTDLIDADAASRYAAGSAVLPEPLRVPRLVTASPDDAAAFLADAVARGHEGVVVKSLRATYDAGRRGAGWLKVKPVHTLDLVVLAAEWGHGRRRGWLSNLHLGARDPASGGFAMLGKTFKGLTDELLAWQTERLLALELSRNDWQVFVRPELVVEVAFDGVQTSPRYPAGMALRFARVVRYRPDKRAEEADTVDAVRAIHERG